MLRKIVLTFTCLGVACSVTLSSHHPTAAPSAKARPRVDGWDHDHRGRGRGVPTHAATGWNLVEYAQHLVARKFTYARLNTWDTPSRAFERGTGYCEQQALALKKVYDRLGIATRPVFSLRCKFPAKVVDGMPWPGGVSGHAWLRVRIAGEELDVCPGSVSNRPDITHFESLWKAHTWHPWLRPFTHLGSSIENIRRDMVARRALTGSVPLKERRAARVEWWEAADADGWRADLAVAAALTQQQAHGVDPPLQQDRQGFEQQGQCLD